MSFGFPVFTIRESFDPVAVGTQQLEPWPLTPGVTNDSLIESLTIWLKNQSFLISSAIFVIDLQSSPIIKSTFHTLSAQSFNDI
jgi:hypothetical protein